MSPHGDGSTVAEQERDERRHAERNPLPEHLTCPRGCRCWQCIVDEADL